MRGCFVALYGNAESLGAPECSSGYLKGRKAPWIAVYTSEAPAALDRSLLREGVDEGHVLDGLGHFLQQQDSESLVI